MMPGPRRDPSRRTARVRPMRARSGRPPRWPGGSRRATPSGPRAARSGRPRRILRCGAGSRRPARGRPVGSGAMRRGSSGAEAKLSTVYPFSWIRRCSDRRTEGSSSTMAMTGMSASVPGGFLAEIIGLTYVHLDPKLSGQGHSNSDCLPAGAVGPDRGAPGRHSHGLLPPRRRATRRPTPSSGPRRGDTQVLKR
jgi:hypothetical protein